MRSRPASTIRHFRWRSASPSCSIFRSRTSSSRPRGAAPKPSNQRSRRGNAMRVFALILAACAACTLNWSSPAQCAPQTSAPEQRLPHISVIQKGSGPGVVFIPGLSSPRASWDSVTAGLAKEHTLYLVQVNGFAGDAPGANLNPGILDGIVADLSAYLNSQKAGRVHLVGHSMGGLASLMFARAHPSQVDRLMIVDALPYFPVLLARGGAVPSPEQVDPIARMMRDTVVARYGKPARSEEHTSELQSQFHLVCRLLLEKKKNIRAPLPLLSSVPPTTSIYHPPTSTP